MRVLLDTQALLAAVLAPSSLSAPAATVIRQEENEILVSAASAWEIATKVRIGKFPEATAFENEFMEVVVGMAGYTLLSITAETALRAGRLTGDHRDPFDRMLAAQGPCRRHAYRQ